MKYFFSHLIEIESINKSLDEMDLSDEERLRLAELIDSSLHHTILDVILSELNDQDKRVFMQHITSNDHDKIWQFLNKKVDDVEVKVKKVVEELKNQLHNDLKEAKRLK